MSRPPAAVTPLPPTAFLTRMRELLGPEYAEFAECYTTPARIGLRVNSLKVGPAEFVGRYGAGLTPLGGFEPAGFLVSDDSRRPGLHPYHAAGLYYLQDPAAMVVAAILRPDPNEHVLDLAAAPGGKASHLAALMQNQGLLVANEVDASRSRSLVENLERLGVRNAVVTSAAAEHVAAHFGPVFDRVLLDAPCSGEGMFRRYGPFEWSPAMVSACARRQLALLRSAASLVRPGGVLAYATCTFSPEENEQVLARFLVEHPGHALVDVEPQPGFAPGRPEWCPAGLAPLRVREQLGRAVRLWPHRFPGEGHFLALLRRAGVTAARTPRPGRFAPSQSQAALAEWHEFSATHLRDSLPTGVLHEAAGRVYLLPVGAWATGRLRLVRYGLLLGEAGRGYFRPAQALAMALRPDQVQLTVTWPADSAMTADYLGGHDLRSDGPNGWSLVAVDGYALGWAKRVTGRLKNHYPKGLRRHSSAPPVSATEPR